MTLDNFVISVFIFDEETQHSHYLFTFNFHYDYVYPSRFVKVGAFRPISAFKQTFSVELLSTIAVLIVFESVKKFLKICLGRALIHVIVNYRCDDSLITQVRNALEILTGARVTDSSTGSVD